jgi:hypothetical protein
MPGIFSGLAGFGITRSLRSDPHYAPPANGPLSAQAPAIESEVGSVVAPEPKALSQQRPGITAMKSTS